MGDMERKTFGTRLPPMWTSVKASGKYRHHFLHLVPHELAPCREPSRVQPLRKAAPGNLPGQARTGTLVASAASIFGTVTVRTPFLKFASISPALRSGYKTNERWKLP